MTGEKTEKATPKRKKEARKEGQVARTPELGAWSTMLLASLALPAMVKGELTALQELMHDALTSIEHPTVDRALELLRDGGTHVFKTLVILGAIIMVIGVGAALAQGGFFLATKAVKPSAKKLNPVSGFKRLFGPQLLWEGAKTLVKTGAVALLVWNAVRAMLPVIGASANADTLLLLTGEHAVALARNVAVAGLVMAACDYAWNRRRTEKQTKMSKEDVKHEHKQAEGDPLVKSAIRARQMAAARNRMMGAVPDADVVMVNPTHVAVALKYDPASGAPKVVARGAGVVAAKIRELATEAEVPMVRDVPLARALYASTEVGQEIPAELFAAVAQVLAFVIARKTRGQLGGTHGTPRSAAEVPTTTAKAGRRRRVATPTGPAADPAPVVPGRRAALPHSPQANPSGLLPAGR
jgi:flagellar biosynthesis protein FlhB